MKRMSFLKVFFLFIFICLFLQFSIQSDLRKLSNRNLEADNHLSFIDTKSFSECSISSVNGCLVNDLTNSTLIYPGGNTRCAHDTIKDLETDARYAFQVFPGKGHDGRKFHLHFQGGGGCVSQETCDYSTASFVEGFIGEPLFFNKVHVINNGIFDIKNPKNPYKDWTTVVLNYCTGDVHVGNRIINEESNVSTYLNGLNNTLAVLKWVKQNIVNPSQLLLSGSSAGALGAIVWATDILSHFQKILPSLEIAVILDSYPGFLADTQVELFQFYNMCHDKYGFHEDIIQKCKKKQLLFRELAKMVHKRFRSIPFAYISSKNDYIQKLFYCLLKYRKTFLKMPGEARSCISFKNFYGGLSNVVKDYILPGEDNNIVSFLMNNDVHVFLPYDYSYVILPDGYTKLESINALIDPSLVEWMETITQNKTDKVIRSQCRAYKEEINELEFDYYCDKKVEEAVFFSQSVRDKEYQDLEKRSNSNTLTKKSILDLYWISIVFCFYCISTNM